MTLFLTNLAKNIIYIIFKIFFYMGPGRRGGGQICSFLPGCVSMLSKEMGPF